MTASSSRKKAARGRVPFNVETEEASLPEGTSGTNAPYGLKKGEPEDVPARRSSGVIVTRPEPGLSETMAAVQAAGWRAYSSPSLEILPRIVPPLRRKIQAVVLTSGQAVPAAGQAVPLDTPVYAVGDRTAQRAQAAGFAHVVSAQGDADALATLLRDALTPQAGLLLLLSGAGQGTGLAADLRQVGFRVVRRVAYEARPVHEMSAEVQRVLAAGQISHILFFSAESVRGWLKALPGSLLAQAAATTAIVMSEAAEDILRHAGWQDVRVATQPNAAALLLALGACR